MINSRDLDALLPPVRTRAAMLIQEAKDEGIDLLVTSTYRDFEAQAACFDRGRKTPGELCRCGGKPKPIGKCERHPLGLTVTMARAGMSWHNWRRALDVVPLIGGKIAWDDATLWSRIGAIGVHVDLEWAGNWSVFREMPHFQWTNGESLTELNRRFPTGI